jgi:hypothetical protein
MSLSTEKGFNMSKINVCDLTISNESGLVDLKDNSSILKSVYGGLLPYGRSNSTEVLAEQEAAALRGIALGLAAAR